MINFIVQPSLFSLNYQLFQISIFGYKKLDTYIDIIILGLMKLDAHESSLSFETEELAAESLFSLLDDYFEKAIKEIKEYSPYKGPSKSSGRQPSEIFLECRNVISLFFLILCKPEHINSHSFSADALKTFFPEIDIEAISSLDPASLRMEIARWLTEQEFLAYKLGAISLLTASTDLMHKASETRKDIHYSLRDRIFGDVVQAAGFEIIKLYPEEEDENLIKAKLGLIQRPSSKSRFELLTGIEGHRGTIFPSIPGSLESYVNGEITKKELKDYIEGLLKEVGSTWERVQRITEAEEYPA